MAMEEINKIIQFFDTKVMFEAADDKLTVDLENLVEILDWFYKERVL